MACCKPKMSKMRVVTLNSGIGMPRLGFGVVAPWKMKQEDGYIEEWVKNAAKIGFRYFDSAPLFRSKEEYERGFSQPESELGTALQEMMTTKKIKRKELFIASSCGNTFHSKDKVRECLEMTLKNMQVSYLDLYLIATPCGIEEGGDLAPMDDKGKLTPSGVDYLETWEAMESFVNEGTVRAIGLSNFSLRQFRRILENCRIKPAVLQMEANAFWLDKALIDYAQKNDVHVTAFSPFGAPERPWATKDTPNLLENETVLEIAKEVNRTGPQVLIRYCLQMGLSVVVRGTSPTNMEQNYDSFDFALTDEQLERLDKLNRRDGRAIYFPELMHHPDYPFHDFSDNVLAAEAARGGGGDVGVAIEAKAQAQQSENRHIDENDDSWE